MREISFRAWDIVNEEMNYGKELWEEGFGRCLIQFDGEIQAVSDGSIRTDSFILLQYTGLKDKYGKKIYEGDIIVSKLLGYSGVPVCDEYTDLMNFFHSVIEYGAKAEDLEIIGNIYENPELLGRKR